MPTGRRASCWFLLTLSPNSHTPPAIAEATPQRSLRSLEEETGRSRQQLALGSERLRDLMAGTNPRPMASKKRKKDEPRGVRRRRD